MMAEDDREGSTITLWVSVDTLQFQCAFLDVGVGYIAIFS